VTSRLRILHNRSVASRSPKGEGFTDPGEATLKWFARTPVDADRVLYTRGVLLAGSEDGTVIAVNSRDGTPQWARKLDAGVVVGPLKLPAGRTAHKGGVNVDIDPIFLMTYPGTGYLLNRADGTELQRITVDGNVLAGSYVVGEILRGLKILGKRYYADALLLIPCTNGKLFAIPFSEPRMLTPIHLINISYNVELYNDRSTESAELCSELLFRGNVILVPFVRDTYYYSPPIVAIALDTGQVLWEASDPAKQFGN
jgi:hypothetical protein